MTKLERDYPNVTKGLSNKWISRFEKSTNPKIVERLFDYLEEKILEESKRLDFQNEDIVVNVSIYSKDWRNYFQIYLEVIYYNMDVDAWESAREFPIALENEIKEYYLNNDEIRTQEKMEDFLVSLPENLDQCLL